jgi:site-specific DNA-cytosine methylase
MQPIRNLVKAGALIAAEIDRLQATARIERGEGVSVFSTILYQAECERCGWYFERPATTVQADRRIWRPGHHANGNEPEKSRNGAIKVTRAQLATLQGMPDDWPWRANATSVGRQIGNLVCPQVAEACVRAVASPHDLSDPCLGYAEEVCDAL